jgi:signal transduction histidine kinase
MNAFTTRMILSVVILNLFVYGLVGFSLYSNRNLHEEQITVAAQNLSLLLKTSIADIIDKADVTLLAVVDEVEHQLATGAIDEQKLNATIARYLVRVPELDGLRVTTARGDAAYGSGVVRGAVKNMADRDYFQYARDNPKGEMFISKPVFGRVANKWVFNIARRVNHPDGTFAGVAYGALPLDYFLKMFAAIDVGPHGAIALRDGSMGIIVRYPEPKGSGSSIGVTAIAPAMKELLSTGHSEGTVHEVSAVDHVERRFSFRKIAPFPLYITIARATSDYLAEWHQEVIKILSLTALFSVVTLVLTWQVVNRWNNEKLVEGELRKSRDELEQRVAERTEEIGRINEDLSAELRERKLAEELLRASEEQVRTLNEDLERRVRERTNELEALNRELEAFSYSVSHDLRAPLRGIDGWSQALLEDYGDRLDAQGKEYLDTVRTEAQRMGQLIDALLTLSRVTRAEIKNESVDLSDLAANVIETLGQGAPERKVAVRITPGMKVTGDPLLLKVLLHNLLGNAWKFTTCRETGEIEFGLIRDDDGRDTYFIRDNGAGFDMAFAGKLFTPFQRLHSLEEYPGTGIGLATVRRIVRRHRGTVRAESEPGKGATFYFTIGDHHD